MIVITVANKSSGFYDQLKQSADKFNVNFETLGWDQPWTGYFMKLDLMKIRMKNADPNEVFMFMDGFDTLILRDLKPLEQMYRQNFYDKIVFSTERRDDFLNKYFLHKVLFGLIDDIALNSGVYIGTARSISIMLDNLDTSGSNSDDQLVVTKYANLYRDRIILDKDNNLFATWSNLDTVDLDYFDNPFTVHGTVNRDLTDTCIKLNLDVSTVQKRNYNSYYFSNVKHYTSSIFKQYYYLFFILIFSLLVIYHL